MSATPSHNPEGKAAEEWMGFTGDSDVRVEGYKYVKASTVKAGMKVETPRGVFKVAKVVKTPCSDGKAEVIDLSDDLDLCVTPWHPIMSSYSREWIFPNEWAPLNRDIVDADYLYSFVLEAGGFAIHCGDFWVATLGSLGSVVRQSDPQLESDPVFYHPFFSTIKVLKALKTFPTNEDGVISLPAKEIGSSLKIVHRFDSK